MNLRATLALLSTFLFGCGLTYQDQIRPSGLTNYHVLVAPSAGVAGIHRTGLPTTAAAVADLRTLVEEPGRHVVRVSLHDSAEGDESWVQPLGWTPIQIPLYPEDDKPWTVLLRPKEADVYRVLDIILQAHARGDVVVFGCVHDRERGGLIAALIGMTLLGWSKSFAFDYMVKTGSRIEVTPGLLDFYVTEVNAR